MGKSIFSRAGLITAEDKKDCLGTFQAVAKPYKWKGKDTWAILSLRSELK